MPFYRMFYCEQYNYFMHTRKIISLKKKFYCYSFGITDYEEFHFVDPEGHKQKAKVSVLRHYAKEKSHTRG